jgi:hypothetical protein
MIDLWSKSQKLMEPTEEDNGYASTLSKNYALYLHGIGFCPFNFLTSSIMIVYTLIHGGSFAIITRMCLRTTIEA